jgi:hypothetical protein|tara:strand:+ start:1231 stop:1506 length:276 start_codon:yes stop_codon:yes gene_type:complete
MSEVGFTVEKDHIETGENSAVGICWAPNLNNCKMIDKHTPGSKRWHAYDDDGIHYYSGWLTGECWEVIYEWAAAYAGATLIKDGQHKGIIG